MTKYYDTTESGLVPVKFVSNCANPYTIEVEVTRSKGAYKKGELLEISRLYFVEVVRKSSKLNPFPLVRVVQL